MGAGCLSTASDSYMHMKYMMFSKTKDSSGVLRSNVIWFGSQNLTTANVFNNAVTVYEDVDLYNSFYNTLWMPQWEERTYLNNDYYGATTCGASTCGYFGSNISNVHVYGSPEQDTDLIWDRLQFINADADCRIRLMEASINRNRLDTLVQKVINLKAAGCQIWVVVDEIHAEPLAAFRTAGIPVRHNEVHDKVILTMSRYAGSDLPRPIVYTGSHNLANKSLKGNDELFVKINDVRPLYDAYWTHFNDAFNTGTEPVAVL
jgi:HKD family nuclease